MRSKVKGQGEGEVSDWSSKSDVQRSFIVKVVTEQWLEVVRNYRLAICWRVFQGERKARAKDLRQQMLTGTCQLALEQQGSQCAWNRVSLGHQSGSAQRHKRGSDYVRPRMLCKNVGFHSEWDGEASQVSEQGIQPGLVLRLLWQSCKEYTDRFGKERNGGMRVVEVEAGSC